MTGCRYGCIPNPAAVPPVAENIHIQNVEMFMSVFRNISHHRLGHVAFQGVRISRQTSDARCGHQHVFKRIVAFLPAVGSMGVHNRKVFAVRIGQKARYGLRRS